MLYLFSQLPLYLLPYNLFSVNKTYMEVFLEDSRKENEVDTIPTMTAIKMPRTVAII